MQYNWESRNKTICLYSTKPRKELHWGKNRLCWNNCTATCWSISHTIYKNWPKWIKTRNVSTKPINIKFLPKTKGKCSWLQIWKIIVIYDTKRMSSNGKNKLDLLKIENFMFQRTPSVKWKDGAYSRRKYQPLFF
jgi:hypothetical protein